MGIAGGGVFLRNVESISISTGGGGGFWVAIFFVFLVRRTNKKLINKHRVWNGAGLSTNSKNRESFQFSRKNQFGILDFISGWFFGSFVERNLRFSLNANKLFQKHLGCLVVIKGRQSAVGESIIYLFSIIKHPFSFRWK